VKFNEEHEWVELDGEIATIGISHYAVKQLGDITYIELPQNDVIVSAGDYIAFIESVKAASDIYTPVSGTVCEVNTNVEQNPQLLNENPQDTKSNWIFKIKIDNVDELKSLMDEKSYENFIETL